MHNVISLLKPRIWSFKNRSRDNKRWIKIGIITTIGGALWLGIFAVSYRVLVYIKGIEDIGDILAFKLLSMILLTLFSLLIFSAILTSLSKLFLSKDLILVHALPVSGETIFLARWIESTVDSSWMVIVYTIPVLVAYGTVYNAGAFFYLNMGITLLPLCIIASGLSALVVLVVVIILPASRIRSVFVFLGLLVFIILFVALRMLKPERLVDPETFSSTLLYLQSLSMPSSPLLPSTWTFDSIKAALQNDMVQSLFHTGLAWSASAFLVFVNLWVAKGIYFKGYSKSQASTIKFLRTEGQWMTRLFSFLPGPTRAFLIKEIKTFWRDQTQWSQIFLIAALVVIYIYNFSVLPLEKSPIKTEYLQNLFSFLNMALAAFVLSAVTARFAFPSISIEGNAFWIVKSGPISIRSFLLIKFFIYLLPLLVLTEILIITTNLLLQVTPLMMYLSTITLFFLTPGVVSIGIGLGAAYPDFSSENPSQTFTSLGGLIFMLLSTAFIGLIIIIEAGPVYTLFVSKIYGSSLSALQWSWIIGSFIANFIISILVIVLPIRYGEKHLAIHLPMQPAKTKRSLRGTDFKIG